MQLVHVEDASRRDRARGHVEQPEEPTGTERGKHEFRVIAQTVVEGEEHTLRRGTTFNPTIKPIAADKSVRALEII